MKTKAERDESDLQAFAAAYARGAATADVFRFAAEVLRLRAELAAAENLADALNSQRAVDAVAAMRAVAEKGEEVREACALAASRMSDSCSAPEVAERLRATPLDATPLRERIAELEEQARMCPVHVERARAEQAEAERDALGAELAAANQRAADNDASYCIMRDAVEVERGRVAALRAELAARITTKHTDALDAALEACAAGYETQLAALGERVKLLEASLKETADDCGSPSCGPCSRMRKALKEKDNEADSSALREEHLERDWRAALAERDEARVEASRLRALSAPPTAPRAKEHIEKLEAERDALKAELAALTLDYADSDKRIMSLKAQVERLTLMMTLARESIERLRRLADGKQGRTPGVALGWIREVTKDAIEALKEKTP